ncbi:unnamed protein product [Parascedosporium putredinis]|uniref:Major facilitator superfamily (MFS) profile domain-containing protein n=1 Tax=Parascedosporium putredinis TaxID=1442378 RepID=A0A9P1H4V3_9PEZI|nr:unnamed protein product [Parascedosporium putredinis]CAI7997294.1 unnamed protein product [Parascedosporium putredinis]
MLPRSPDSTSTMDQPLMGHKDQRVSHAAFSATMVWATTDIQPYRPFDPASILILDRLNQVLARLDDISERPLATTLREADPQIPPHCNPSPVSAAPHRALDDYDQLHIPSSCTSPDAVLQWPIFEGRYPPNYLIDSTFASEARDSDVDTEEPLANSWKSPHTGSTARRWQEQRLYWSCYKSECELRTEMDIPDSLLADFRYPDLYPSPPNAPEHEVADTGHIAADVFAGPWNPRRPDTINHQHERTAAWTISAIPTMVKMATEFEMHLNTWFEQLPGPIQFDWDIRPRDELGYMVYGRALEIRLAIYRPFLYLAIHEPTNHASMASILPLVEKAILDNFRGLSSLLIRHRHHGTWYGIRGLTAAAICILGAALSQRVPLPSDWERSVRQGIISLQYWEHELPEVARIVAVLEELIARVRRALELTYLLYDRPTIPARPKDISARYGEELSRVLPQDGIPWYKKKNLLFLNYCALSIALLAAANGFDGSMMNGLMALPQWNSFMDHPKGAWLGFINAIQALSSTLAYPLVAYSANRWGRKPGLYVGYVFLVLGALLQALTPNIPGFVVSRFFLGQPSAWWGGLAPLLITELAYPTHRAFLTALYNCGCLARRSPDARITALPYIQGKRQQARDIMTRLHANGDESSPLVDFEMRRSKRLLLRMPRSHRARHGGPVQYKGNRHRALISITLGVFAQWNGVGVVSYYLALVLTTVGITSVTDQTLISGFLQIWNLILAVGAAACVDRLGRRPLFLTSSVGMLISFILISGLSGGFATSGSSKVGIAVVPFLYIYYGFYDIAFTPLIVSYPAEIWPYFLRARGSHLSSSRPMRPSSSTFL